ncbi:MAG: DUF4350 domain-containing protein [Treponema sp.]|nr:DUF4350 domain-containing protein [Treponema sp.]
MRNKLIGFAICLGILGIGAFIFYNYYTIEDYQKSLPPSREARTNQYLALDRWLVSQGFSVRTKTEAGPEELEASAEKIIFIQSGLVDWNNDMTGWLRKWVANGGRLILCLDYYQSWNENDPLGIFLQQIGVYYRKAPENTEYRNNPYAPLYGRNIMFEEPYEASLVLYDENGFPRLIEIQIGSGAVIVTGRPRFLTSNNIAGESNARLCWYLFNGSGFTADSGNVADAGKSVFFVRGETRPQGLVGRFFQHGNFLIIIITCIFLTAVGFWMAIPVFGIVRADQNQGKALAERFLAEGRFLKRFNSLDSYRAVYIREIKHRLGGISDDEFIARAAEFLTDGEGGVPAVTKAVKNNLRKKDNFIKSIVILKTIMERI